MPSGGLHIEVTQLSDGAYRLIESHASPCSGGAITPTWPSWASVPQSPYFAMCLVRLAFCLPACHQGALRFHPVLARAAPLREAQVAADAWLDPAARVLAELDELRSDDDGARSSSAVSNNLFNRRNRFSKSS